MSIRVTITFYSLSHKDLCLCFVLFSQIKLGRTLKAIVILRGLMIEWVKVKAFDESFENEDGQVCILFRVQLIYVEFF